MAYNVDSVKQLQGFISKDRSDRARAAAKIGMMVRCTDREGDRCWGKIVGIYPFVCALEIKHTRYNSMECFIWFDMADMLYEAGYM